MKNILTNNKTIDVIIFTLIITVLFILVFFLNKAYPMYGDDWTYVFIYRSNPLEEIKSIKDIIQSQYNHYLLWGGRTVSHFILQFILMFPPLIRDLLNSLMFISLNLLIYKISTIHTNRLIPYLPLFTFLFLWFSFSYFIGTAIYLSASVNYLWGTFIVCLCMKAYYNYYYKEKIPTEWYEKFLFWFLSFISGWISETLSPALITIIVIFVYLKYRETNKLSYIMLSGIVLCIIGYLFLFFAPGNFIRLNSESGDPTENMNIFKMFFLNGIFLLKRVLNSSLPNLFLIYILFLALCVYKEKLCLRSNKTLMASLVFVLGAIISIILLLPTPNVHPRVFFQPIVLVIISISMLVVNIKINSNKYLKILKLITALFIFSFLIEYFWKKEAISHVSDIWQDRENIIMKEKEKGNKDIVFMYRYNTKDEFYLRDIKDKDDWLYKAYIHFYDINSVSFDNDNK